MKNKETRNQIHLFSSSHYTFICFFSPDVFVCGPLVVQVSRLWDPTWIAGRPVASCHLLRSLFLLASLSLLSAQKILTKDPFFDTTSGPLHPLLVKSMMLASRSFQIYLSLQAR